ncbi:MAG: ATP-binding protein, partial [Clostridia bacterium]
ISSLYDGDNSIANAATKNHRITIIDATGKVLADSDYENVTNMSNHISREEVIAAINGKPSTVLRKSETTGEDMIYYALKKDVGDSYVFIRTAVNIKSVNAYVLKTVPLMFGIAAGAILCAVLCSIFMSMKVIEPLRTVKDGLNNIKDGKYKKISSNSGDKELNEIVGDINSIGETLNSTMAEIESERNNLNQIVNAINDGIVLFDNTSIRLINDSVKDLFGCTDAVIGKSAQALTENRAIIDAVANAVKGTEWNSFECEENHRTLIGSIKPVQNDSNGYILAVFSDMTAERNSQKIRSDFFANAGHELKTPLTAITGFNDLIVQKDKDEAYAKYTAQISSNAERMLNLVNDMLKLSELETASPENINKVNVREVAEMVISDLSVLAENKNTAITIEGDAEVNAAEPHIYELLKNLVENSIKYGKENGNVKVDLSQTAKQAQIVVTDNGIGIDEKHQSRIFERFYRVEKSRSRATGGTGLGLAIVKHIALLYNGEISIKSKLGIGTTITISFKS